MNLTVAKAQVTNFLDQNLEPPVDQPGPTVPEPPESLTISKQASSFEMVDNQRTLQDLIAHGVRNYQGGTVDHQQQDDKDM